jgi:hypothetical protein
VIQEAKPDIQPVPALLGVWLLLRTLTWLAAVLVAPLRPITAREQAIPAWPPSEPLGAWLERVLLAPWERRDAILYVTIVDRGYRADDGTAQFHPLLAWLATPVAWLAGSPLLGLVLVSSAASLALAFVFERLARLDLEPEQARAATLLLLFSPPVFVLFAPYTEGLFLLCAALCLLWARQGRWWLAGLAGALATLTRQQGLFLLLPLAWELLEWTRAEARRIPVTLQSKTQHPKSKILPWLSLSLIPAGLLVWLVYRGLALGDLRADLSNPQALIYSLLISPSSSLVVPEQAFLLPPHALWLALEKLVRAPEYSLVIDLALAAVFLVMAALAWPRMRTSYRIYTAAIVLVSFAYYTGPFYPYMGLPRHLLLALPVFIGLGPLLTRRLRPIIVSFGLVGTLFLVVQYVVHGWVP